MDKPINQLLKCPVGEQDCQWQEEISRLQRQVGELAELVSHDPLTGLYNVRYFEQIIPKILEGTRRSNHPSCLIMIDLDHFKNINDTWGHEVGNIALKQAASILTQQVRMIDIVCRYGGEEFIVILPDTQLRQAVTVAERVRKTFAATPVIFNDGEFSFTASMGVEIYRKDHPITAREFIEEADKLLYQAKNAGRNRIAHRDFSEVEVSTAVSQEEREALFGRSDNDNDESS